MESLVFHCSEGEIKLDYVNTDKASRREGPDMR